MQNEIEDNIVPHITFKEKLLFLTKGYLLYNTS